MSVSHEPSFFFARHHLLSLTLPLPPESGIQAVTWSAVEVNIGIVCASLIALKPLLAHFCPCLLQDYSPPGHSTRLPMVQTEDVEEGRGLFSRHSRSSSSPIAPVSPSSVMRRSLPSIFQRASVAATLPGAPQAEGLSFVDMLVGGPGLGRWSREGEQ